MAGLMDSKRESFEDIGRQFCQMVMAPTSSFQTAENKEKVWNDEARMNTTIGCVITNAKFDKAKLNKIASMTRNAYADVLNRLERWQMETIYCYTYRNRDV